MRRLKREKSNEPEELEFQLMSLAEKPWQDEKPKPKPKIENLF